MRRRAAIGVAALLAGSIATFAAPAARADPVADKQAQAEQISTRLDQLDSQTERLAEEYNQTRLQLGDVQHQIDAAAARLSTANAELTRRRAELAEYAVTAYLKGGESDLPDILLKGSGPDVSRQIEYLQAASSSRRQLVDDVRAAQQAADTQLTDLQAARDNARSLQADLDQRRADTQKASDEQAGLLAQVNGELGDLVAQAQQRQAAAAEEAAKARLAAAHEPAPTTTAPSTAPQGPTAPGVPLTSPPSSPPVTRPPVNPPVSPPPTAPPVVPPPTTPTPWPVPTGAPPAVLPQAAAVVALAETQLGVPYLWGGDNPTDGFDCSGLVLWAWRNAGGRSFPHSAELQARMTRRISFSDLRPGDLVFFGAPVEHVGIYVGGGRMIEAPHTGAFVRYSSIWRANLVAAGRVL